MRSSSTIALPSGGVVSPGPSSLRGEHAPARRFPNGAARRLSSTRPGNTGRDAVRADHVAPAPRAPRRSPRARTLRARRRRRRGTPSSRSSPGRGDGARRRRSRATPRASVPARPPGRERRSRATEPAEPDGRARRATRARSSSSAIRGWRRARPRRSPRCASRRPSRPPTAAPDAAAAPEHIDTEATLVESFAEPGAEDGAGAQIRIEEPWEGYGELSAADVIARLEQASADGAGGGRAVRGDEQAAHDGADRRRAAAEGPDRRRRAIQPQPGLRRPTKPTQENEPWPMRTTQRARYEAGAVAERGLRQGGGARGRSHRAHRADPEGLLQEAPARAPHRDASDHKKKVQARIKKLGGGAPSHRSPGPGRARRRRRGRRQGRRRGQGPGRHRARRRHLAARDAPAQRPGGAPRGARRDRALHPDRDLRHRGGGQGHRAARAQAIRRDEERMAKFLDAELKRLVKEVVRAEVPRDQRGGTTTRRRSTSVALAHGSVHRAGAAAARGRRPPPQRAASRSGVRSSQGSRSSGSGSRTGGAARGPRRARQRSAAAAPPRSPRSASRSAFRPAGRPTAGGRRATPARRW